MLVTTVSLREQVTRLEAVCELYIRDKDVFYDTHKDAYERICGTIVCDFVSCFRSAYSYLNGLDNMTSSNISIKASYREIVRQLDASGKIWRECHKRVSNSVLDDMRDVHNNLNILRDLRNIPVHQAQWGGLLRTLSQGLFESIFYITALMDSCIEEELDYARCFDIALNVYGAMETLVYDN